QREHDKVQNAAHGASFLLTGEPRLYAAWKDAETVEVPAPDRITRPDRPASSAARRVGRPAGCCVRLGAGGCAWWAQPSGWTQVVRGWAQPARGVPGVWRTRRIGPVPRHARFALD